MSVPVINFFQFDIAGPDPLLNNYTTPLGILNETDAGALKFGVINLDASAQSDTKVLNARVTNMGGNLFIRNMRFWAPSVIFPAAISYNKATAGSTGWIDNNVITSASGIVPTILPTSQNLFRHDGHPAISGLTTAEVSQWVYLNLSVTSSLAVGNYGGSNGQGVLRYRMTFDYGE